MAYDSTNDKVVIAYKDHGNSSSGTVIRGTVSGTSISFDAPFVFQFDSIDWPSIAYDSDNSKMIVGFRDNANSDYGTAIVMDSTTLVNTNLTSSNFLGFSDAGYTNGQTAKIQIAGSVDDAQTGLTTGSGHFVQNNGSLGTTAANPSVFAGTAISGTKIIVRK